MSDYISRADAIEALCHNCAYYTDAQCKTDSGYWCESGAMIREDIPTAEAVQEAVPTVVRVTMSDGSQYYLEHERDAIQADAVDLAHDIPEYCRWSQTYTNMVQSAMADTKSADAVNVVRCKDCRYFKKIVERSDSGLCYRDLVASAWKENGYCSRGERREP